MPGQDRKSLGNFNSTLYNVSALSPLAPLAVAPWVQRAAEARIKLFHKVNQDFMANTRVDPNVLRKDLLERARLLGAKIPEGLPGQPAMTIGQSHYDPVQKKIYQSIRDPLPALAHEIGHHVDMGRGNKYLNAAKRNIMLGLAAPIVLETAGLLLPMTPGERDATFGASLATLGATLGTRYQLERAANRHGARLMDQALRRAGSPVRFNPNLFKGSLGTYGLALPLMAAGMTSGLGYFGYRAGQGLGLWGKPS